MTLISIIEEAEKLIPDILNKVESEYGMGGLSVGLYADYAADVSKRHNNQTILKLVEGIEEWAEVEGFFEDNNFYKIIPQEKLLSLFQPLKDKLKQ